MNAAVDVTVRDELIALTNQLAEAYNNQDAESVTQMFAQDGIFDDMDGKKYQGHDAILKVTRDRIMSVGKLNFVEKDLYVDEVEAKVALHWTLTITTPYGSSSAPGTDILHWQNGKIILKSTFFKTQMPTVSYASNSLTKKLKMQLYFMKKSFFG